MDKHQVESEATVLVATLASTKPLNASSLLCSTICTLLLIFSEHILLQGMAGIGILAGLIQSYFNWRVVLDRKLIPLLIQFGTTRFDQALSTVFQSKAQQLGVVTSIADLPVRAHYLNSRAFGLSCNLV